MIEKSKLGLRHAKDGFPIDIPESVVFNMDEDYEIVAGWRTAINNAESPAYIRVKENGSTYVFENGTETTKLPDTFIGPRSEKHFRNDLYNARN